MEKESARKMKGDQEEKERTPKGSHVEKENGRKMKGNQ